MLAHWHTDETIMDLEHVDPANPPALDNGGSDTAQGWAYDCSDLEKTKKPLEFLDRTRFTRSSG